MEPDHGSGASRTEEFDVVVVGAGPYGLSTAAHLRGRGLHVRVFGRTFETWRKHMPKGMFLRSHSWATNLSDPGSLYGFDAFVADSGIADRYPLPLDSFIEYGLWFQRRAVPDVDETYVTSIRHDGGVFVVVLRDGRVVRSAAIVLALGLPYYKRIPPEFQGLPPGVASHSSDHDSFDRFRGKRVVVVGGGQSALEYAALLHESRAIVDVVARRKIDWLPPDRFGQRSLFERVRAPENGIGPGWLNWVFQYFPFLFHSLPQSIKVRVGDSHTRNWGVIDWVRDRVVNRVKVREGSTIVRTTASNDGIAVTLSSGEAIQADHVLLATGYHVDIDRLPILDPSLKRDIRQIGGAPVLNRSFETSVPGMYFVGPTSVRSFGPLYRFVLGCRATAPRVARSVERRLKTRHQRQLRPSVDAPAVSLETH